MLVTFDGQELPVFNAGVLQGFDLRVLLFYLPKVWQWRHINDETFPVLQRFCQHKSNCNAHMWQQFAVFQKH